MPPRPTIGQAFTHALERGRNLGPRGMPVTLERVTRVMADGRVEVLGAIIPTAGDAGRRLRAGDQVATAWQRGRPVVAMAHTARRSGVPGVRTVETNPVLEELFLVLVGDTSEVWFRNGDQLVQIVTGLNTASATIHWGTPGDGESAETASDYFCVADSFARLYRVYRLNRPDAGRPFPVGFAIEAELVETYALADLAHSFGTLSVACTDMAPLTPGGDSQAFTYAPGGPLVRNEFLDPPETVVGAVGIGRGARFAGITPDGDLLLRVFLAGSTLLLGALVGNDPDPPESAAGFPIRLLPHCGALLVNAKTGQVLVNHTASVGISVIAAAAGPSGELVDVVAAASYTVDSPGQRSPAGDLRLLSLRRVGDTYLPDRYLVLGPPRVLVGDAGTSASAQKNVAAAQVVTLITPTGATPLFTSVGGNVQVVEHVVIDGQGEVGEVGTPERLRTATRDWVVFYSKRIFTPAGIPVEIRLHALTSGVQRVVGRSEFPDFFKLHQIVPGDRATLVNLDDAHAQAEPYFLDPTALIDLDAAEPPPRDASLDAFAALAEIPGAEDPDPAGAVIRNFDARAVQVLSDPAFPGGA